MSAHWTNFTLCFLCLKLLRKSFVLVLKELSCFQNIGLNACVSTEHSYIGGHFSPDRPKQMTLGLVNGILHISRLLLSPQRAIRQCLSRSCMSSDQQSAFRNLFPCVLSPMWHGVHAWALLFPFSVEILHPMINTPMFLNCIHTFKWFFKRWSDYVARAVISLCPKCWDDRNVLQ